MLGTMFILEGCAFLVNRFFLGNPGGASAAGILSIIAGSFLASFILAVYSGFFVLAAALIVGGVVLARAPIPHPPYPGQPAAPPPFAPSAPSPPYGPAR